MSSGPSSYRPAGRRLGLGVVVVLTLLCWASAFVAIRAAVRGYPPLPMASLRFAISVPVAAAWIALAGRQRWPRGRAVLWLFLASGVGGAAYHLALNAGTLAMGAGAAGLVVAVAPVFTALIAGAFLRERLGARAWLGVAIAAAGVTLVSLRRVGAALEPHPAVLLFVVSALAQAAIHVVMRRYLRDYSTAAISAFGVWANAVCLIPFAPTAWRLVPDAPLSATVALVYLGIVPGAIGGLGWTYVLARIPAGRAATLLYVVPPLTLAMAWLVLGERPAPLAVLGGALALGGVALVGTGR